MFNWIRKYFARQDEKMMEAVENYRRHKHFDLETIEQLRLYVRKCHAKVDYGTPSIEDEMEYRRAQRDYNNARAYYEKFGG